MYITTYIDVFNMRVYNIYYIPYNILELHKKCTSTILLVNICEF